MVHRLAGVLHAKGDLAAVQQESAHMFPGVHVIELGYQLFEVGHVAHAVGERIRDAVEHAIGMVVPAVLQAQHQLRMATHQVEQDETGRRVVGAVQESVRAFGCGSTFTESTFSGAI